MQGIARSRLLNQQKEIQPIGSTVAIDYVCFEKDAQPTKSLKISQELLLGAPS